MSLDIHPDLTERDLLPIQELLDDVRAQSRAEQLISATITWLNALTQFKRARRRYGLPKRDSAFHAYGTVVSDLKANGKAILCCLDAGMFTLDHLPMDKRNFAACVRELECDDIILGLGLLKKDLSHVEALFATT